MYIYINKTTLFLHIGGWGSETGLTVPPNREIVFRVRDVIVTRSCVSARRDSGVARAGGTEMSCSSSCCSCPPVCPVASRRVPVIFDGF